MIDVMTQMLEKPPKPTPPLPEECCGGGCVPCIYDYYYEQLSKWEADVKAMEKSSEVAARKK